MMRDLVLVLAAGAVQGLLNLWAVSRLLAWRVKALEDRMRPVDAGQTNLFTRVARLEIQAANNNRRR